MKLLLFSCILILTSCDKYLISEKQYTQDVIEFTELGYFMGQRAALEGYIFVEYDTNGCYRWIGSPWKDGRKTIHVPDCKLDEAKKKHKL